LSLFDAGCCLPLGDPLCERIGRHWFAKKIALDKITAILAEYAEAGIVFNAFGNNGQTHVVAELNGRANDDSVVVVFTQIEDKGFINFEFIDGQALELR
jgi:hypothetical protein